jgi:hypothetical protein
VFREGQGHLEGGSNLLRAYCVLGIVLSAFGGLFYLNSGNKPTLQMISRRREVKSLCPGHTVGQRRVQDSNTGSLASRALSS